MRRVIRSILYLLPLVVGSGVVQGDSYVFTVRGKVPVSELGTTLQHEHVLVDFIGAAETGSHRWDRAEVVEKVSPYLEEIQALGCTTLMECTPAYIGRDPLLLKQLSEATGMHLLTNTGLYGARDNFFIPESAKGKTAEELAAGWIAEFENGIEGTGIRPGFIKIGVNPDAELSLFHQTLVRAAGLTHKATGLTIMSHTGPPEPAFAQLEILASMGVPADAFIWTHAQRGSMETWVACAEKGAWVSIDNVRDRNFEKHADSLAALKEKGLLGRILISHDAGWYRPGEPGGGKFNGYTPVFESLVPALRERGFDQDDIDQLLIRNPAEAFALDTN
ncbi:MAG: phosphotriesterase [Verrucomicrobiota bacterium]